MSKFGDLTPEDKAKVIGGFIYVGIFLVLAYFFTYFFIVEDRYHLSSLWESDVSGFAIMRTLLPTICFIVALPAIIPATAIGAWLTKHSLLFVLRNTLTVLLMTGAAFGLIALLLTGFDLLLSNRPRMLQIPLIALVFSCPLMIIAGMLRTEKTRRFMQSCGLLRSDDEKQQQTIS